MKFSLWPFRRKKITAEEPEAIVQPPAKNELPGDEFGKVAESELRSIESPADLPILGEAGGWNTMQIRQPGSQPGIVPFEERLEISNSKSSFRPMIEQDEFTDHLAGLSSFNISEILSGRNEAASFPDELPTLGEGMTDILAQPGSLPEQIPGMAGIAPILSVPQPNIQRMVMGQDVDEPAPSSQPEKMKGLPTIGGLRSHSQTMDRTELGLANSPMSLPLIRPQSALPVSLIGSAEPSMGLNQPASSMTILHNAESILSAPEQLTLAGSIKPSENILINAFNSGTQSELPLGGIDSGRPALSFANLDNPIESSAMPMVSGSIQMEKDELAESSDNISAPLGIRSEAGEAEIARMVEQSGKLATESEPGPLVYLEGGPFFEGNEDNRQASTEIISNQINSTPIQAGFNPSITGNFPTMRGQMGGNIAAGINLEPMQMATLAQNLILRQSRPAEEMVMSIQMEREEPESGQYEPISGLLFNDNALDREEQKPQNYNFIENTPLIQKMDPIGEEINFEDNPFRQALQAKDLGNTTQGLLQRATPGNLLNRMGQSVSRFAMPGQVADMSMLENPIGNAIAGTIQEMRAGQSEEMPLFNQGNSTANQMALGGGLPQMPLPPTIGETIASFNSAASGAGQNITESVDKAAQPAEQPEIPQMPSIDRLTDQIWQQIQRRLQIERERSRGMA